MNSITLKCNAKINLSLDVIRRREDGYHDVELIYNEIDLYDMLTITLRDDGKIILTCDDDTLPTDRQNIAYRAAEALLAAAGSSAGAEIDIKKRIPHGAGLAGGSADAAGVLKGLNTLLGTPIKHDRIMELGKGLGADVPFCITGGCAFAEGIGEILTYLPKPADFTYVIVKPRESISTAFVYQNLNLTDRPPNLSVRAVAEGIASNNKDMIFSRAGNIMESVTIKAVPIIADIKKALEECGTSLALMSGSGTSVFGVFEDLNSAKSAAESMKRFDGSVYVV